MTKAKRIDSLETEVKHLNQAIRIILRYLRELEIDAEGE